jgi:hypothetical protein
VTARTAHSHGTEILSNGSIAGHRRVIAITSHKPTSASVRLRARRRASFRFARDSGTRRLLAHFASKAGFPRSVPPRFVPNFGDVLYCPLGDEGRARGLSCRRLRLRRGDALPCGGQERVEAWVSMQGLELVVLFNGFNLVDRTKAFRIGPQVDEGLIPLAL